MSCCSWPLYIVAWVSKVYSSKKYEDESDFSDDEPPPRFRDLGQMKHRFTKVYDLREKKPVCYTEVEEDD